jgi:hypothetical protein
VDHPYQLVGYNAGRSPNAAPNKLGHLQIIKLVCVKDIRNFTDCSFSIGNITVTHTITSYALTSLD